ncbi:elongator complex protein 5 [Hoplias malabaricus]|uniref:elongator complex protein 5 n=1 Tax=Hoplias malabaricus TaxID=27720 RepID=UPI003462FACE
MLLEVLQGTEPGGIVIIRDTSSYSGRHLLKYYINCTLKREEDVHVLGFEVPDQEMRAGLDSNCMHLFHFHNAYEDPLGWTSQSSFTVKEFNAADITRLVCRRQHAKASVLVIDSLTWVIRHHNPVAVCQQLQELKRGGSVRMIFCLLHTDLHQQGVVGSICHLASTIITVTSVNNAHYAAAKMIHRKKSGKIVKEDEFFSVTEDFTLSKERRPSQPAHVQMPDTKADPTSNLTFNLCLSEVEREAKEKVALPFVFSQEKKSALLNQRQGCGRIIYEPDAADDFDEEDPDDDLNV